MHLILYTKPGCHLCEGLQEKLSKVTLLQFELEIRDITTNDRWWQLYQFEVPVLAQKLDSAENAAEKILPRLSPRASVTQLEQLLQKYLFI